MPIIPMSEIVILIDVSSLDDELWSDELMDQITEAVSFQISRETITNRKLIQMGIEPYLGRVKWAYSFVDATSTASEQRSLIGKPLEALTHEHWDLFRKNMNEAVKLFQVRKPLANTTVSTRMSNLMEILELVKLSMGQQQPPDNNGHYHLRRLSEDRDHPPLVQVIFVFTSVPKVFSTLIHLARNLTQCRHSIASNTQGSPNNVQICLVDLYYNPSIGPVNSGNSYCFWDELYEGKESTCFSLKISCLKKIIMIHKLEELRHPWKYENSVRLPFGFGMGMKRLRQLEWRTPQDSQFQREPDIPCLPLRLRRCWSDDW